MSSPKFLKAIPFIFEHEGGYNNITGDHGGATNWGVSLRLLKSLNDDINHDGKIDHFTNLSRINLPVRFLTQR